MMTTTVVVVVVVVVTITRRVYPPYTNCTNYYSFELRLLASVNILGRFLYDYKVCILEKYKATKYSYNNTHYHQ